jgi:uncharacterized protein DUF1569
MDPRLERLQLAIETAMAGQSAQQRNWHPPGKWCTAEVLEHLYLTYTGTVKGFERVAAAGESLASAPTWKQRVQTSVVVDFGYLPTGRESPAVARPRGLSDEKVISEISLKIAEMDGIIRRCEEKFGMRKRLLDHPILGPLTGAQWRKFHLVHGLHHVKQIRHLREMASGRK